MIMPVHCPIAFPRLTGEEMRPLDFEVMRYAFAAHKALGCLCDESVYQAHLTHQLAAVGLKAECEVPVTLTFRDFVKTLYLDLVVNRSAIYELKTVASLTDAHITQLLNYLFLTNCARGKLVNFRPSSVESQFVNSALDEAERRRFPVDATRWSGTSEFRELIEELVADWGTGLDQSLYTQAVVHCLGGEEVVTRQVPMQLDGVPLGEQRFHLVNDETAARITTFQEELGAQQQQLVKLMAASPLKTLYWVNIARHKVHLQTVER
jgi:GxxExxY protein